MLSAGALEPDGNIRFRWQSGAAEGLVTLRFRPDGRGFDGLWWSRGAPGPEGRFSGVR